MYRCPGQLALILEGKVKSLVQSMLHLKTQAVASFPTRAHGTHFSLASLVPRPPQAFNCVFGFKSGLGLVDFVPSSLRQVDAIVILALQWHARLPKPHEAALYLRFLTRREAERVAALLRVSVNHDNRSPVEKSKCVAPVRAYR